MVMLFELPMKEDHIYNNKTFYGATKIAGEHMCRAYYNRYGLDYVGLRYMNVYGPRQDYKGTYIAVIMKILDRLDQGLPQLFTVMVLKRMILFTLKMLPKQMFVQCLSGATDKNYNVGSGTQTSIKELAELILELTGSKLDIQYEPAEPTFVTNRIGDATNAINDLGFKYKVELREGIQQLIDWRNTHKAEVEAKRLAALA